MWHLCKTSVLKIKPILKSRDTISPRCEILLLLLALEFDQRREKQDHIAALVHDGAVAVRAADFAGQLVLDRFARGVVPFQVVVAVLEADVVFVEDCCPLEGSGWVGC